MSKREKPSAAMRIEYTPLEEILKAPRNPKKHDAAQLDASVRRFGFADPPTVDERTGKLVEGHGRIEALVRLKASGGDPPARIEVSAAGEWLVPVVRGVAFKSAREAEAYLIAHNRIGDSLWDDAALAAALAEQENVAGLGFEDAEVSRLMSKYGHVDVAGVEFKEYDESAADGVVVHECPKCGHRFS